MSHSNRIGIVIGIHNSGHHAYWSSVFNLLHLPMGNDLSNNLLQLDQRKDLKRKYNGRTEVKKKRVRKNNEKMKELIQKQMEDAKRGATYRSGMAIEELIPLEVVRKYNERKTLERRTMSDLWLL